MSDEPCEPTVAEDFERLAKRDREDYALSLLQRICEYLMSIDAQLAENNVLLTRININISNDNPQKDYFTSVNDRLQAMCVSRGALARELDMDGAQMNRYFTVDDPNPQLKTMIAIERALVTLRRRKGQENSRSKEGA